MSTDRQESSITDQRGELEKHAKAKGYRIVGEYVDEGISGDATEKRLAFQRMVADCGKKRFDLILCWDQDRFGRFDPLEGGYWIKPIRDAGVQLETIAQGRIDWSDFASRLVWTVTQEAKHAYLRTLARDSVRGVASAVQKGSYPGKAPYGYRKENKRLVLGPSQEVETVREIYRLKISGMGYRTIANVLAAKGVPAPGAGYWTMNQVRYIVDRQTYFGRTTLGIRKAGKYERHSKRVVLDGTHEPIVDEATWKAAQLSKREGTVKYRGGKITGALTGLLKCGLCGSSMYRFKYGAERGYVCGSYHRAGKCGFCRIMDGEALRLIASEIEEWTGRDPERLRKRIQRQLAMKSKAVDTAELSRKLGDLERQIARATNRLLTVDDETFAVLNRKVQELRVSHQITADAIEATRPATTIDPAVIAARLCELPTKLLTARPDAARAAIAACVKSITVNFRQQARTCQRRFFDFESLEIQFRD